MASPLQMYHHGWPLSNYSHCFLFYYVFEKVSILSYYLSTPDIMNLPICFLNSGSTIYI
jgi:hypothetical protein